jgi:hypothetical protein
VTAIDRSMAEPFSSALISWSLSYRCRWFRYNAARCRSRSWLRKQAAGHQVCAQNYFVTQVWTEIMSLLVQRKHISRACSK